MIPVPCNASIRDAMEKFQSGVFHGFPSAVYLELKDEWLTKDVLNWMKSIGDAAINPLAVPPCARTAQALHIFVV